MIGTEILNNFVSEYTASPAFDPEPVPVKDFIDRLVAGEYDDQSENPSLTAYVYSFPSFHFLGCSRDGRGKLKLPFARLKEKRVDRPEMKRASRCVPCWP